MNLVILIDPGTVEGRKALRLEMRTLLKGRISFMIRSVHEDKRKWADNVLNQLRRWVRTHGAAIHFCRKWVRHPIVEAQVWVIQI